MRTRACLFGLVLVLGAGLASCSKSDSNAVDIQQNVTQIQAALGQARSWHVSSSFAISKEISHIEEDVSCPFNYHRVGRVFDGVRRMPDEILAIEYDYYSREDDQWRKLHTSGNDYCKDGPSAGAYPLARSLEAMKGSSTLRKGELQTVDGNPCREFEFISNADTKLKFASICVDEQTHLPYEFRHGPDVHQYSKWNEPVTLEPPTGL